MRLPWFIRAVWQPDIEFDLMDAHGKPDHGKTVGIFAFWVDVILIIWGKTPPLGIFIALNSVVFGWVGWRTFLKTQQRNARRQRQIRIEPEDEIVDEVEGAIVTRPRAEEGQ